MARLTRSAISGDDRIRLSRALRSAEFGRGEVVTGMPKDFYDQVVAIMLEAGCWRVPGGKGSH